MINGANIKRAYYYLKKNGIKNTFYASCERLLKENRMQYHYVEISNEEQEQQKNTQFDEKVRFSILVPMYETKEEYARDMIESVLMQTYSNFELILADASKTSRVEKVVCSFFDERIRYIKVEHNDGISENTNKALREATGDYIGLLDHDDLLTRNALFEMAQKINEGKQKNKGYAFVYSDEDKCDSNANNFYEPNIKPEFNLDLLLSNNYICHFTVMEADLMKKLSFRKEYDGAQDHDIVLRAYAQKRPDQLIGHVNKVLYHWRCHETSTAANPQSKRYAYIAGKNAILNYLQSKDINANVIDTKHNGFYRVEYGDKNHMGASTLGKRSDVGLIAGHIYKKNKITSGIIDAKGVCPYAGMNRNFSGYLHRAALQQDCNAADLSNMMIKKELLKEFVTVLNDSTNDKLNFDLTNKKFESEEYILIKDVFDFRFLSDKQRKEISIAFCTAARKRGTLILFDPEFDSSKEEKKKDIENKTQTTVVIPNYNGKRYLKECLDSLIKCQPYNFNILVVDNGSNDGSVSFLEENYKDIKVIALSENTGFSGAVNVGIKNAKTKYVILLNNDTTVDKDFVKNLVRVIKTDNSLFSVSAKMLSMKEPDKIDGAGDLYCSLGWAFALGKEKDANKYYKNSRTIFSACAGAAIYRSSVFDQIGYFDENHFAYLEDVDIGYRARIYGYKNRFEPGAICYHAGSGFSGSRYNEFKITLSSKNSIYLIYKNMPFIQLLINLPFLIIGFLIKTFFFVSKGYGIVYCKGLWKGLCFCFTKEAHNNKVHFNIKNLFHYFTIQMQLWWNMIQRFLI